MSPRLSSSHSLCVLPGYTARLDNMPSSGILLLLLLFVEIASSSSPVARVVALAGGEAHLPCDLSPANDSVALVLWYKDALPTPVYSVDARRGDVAQARHSSIAWGPRAYFLTQPPGLRLQSLAVGDSGVYRCRVDFRKDRTRNHETTLTVIEPPKKPVIRDAEGDGKEALRSLIGPYNEGDRLSLVCDVEGGVPTPSVSWWRESVQLEGNQSELRPGVMRSSLGPFILRRQDLMAVLVCQASNSNLTAPSTTSITLDMNFRPLEVSIEAQSPTLEAGKTGWIVCRAVGSRPRSRITWFLSEEVLKGAKQNESLDGNVTLSRLPLVASAEHHGRVLRCRADNDLISGSEIFADFTLHVLYPPKLTMTLAPNQRHSKLREGQDVYLECKADANPPATDFRWWFGKKEIFTDRSGRMLLNNRTLVLQKVQLHNRGPYRCTARNTQGESTSNSMHLKLQYAPVCREGQQQVYGAASNQAVSVNCEVESEPPAKSFTWQLNNDSVTNFTRVTLKSQLTFTPRFPLDLDKIYCWAANDVGIQRTPCVYTLEPARIPESPRNCSVHNRTAHSFVVDCESGDDGGMPAVYVLRVQDSLNRTLRNLTSRESPTWTVSGISGSAKLSLVLFAVTPKGRSALTVLQARTLASSQSLKEPLWHVGLSPLLMVLVASAVGVISVAFLVALFLRYRSKHERHKPEPMKGDEDQQIAPLQQYPDGVLKMRSPQSEEKCPDVVLDVSGSEERIKEEERPQETVRWKGWTEADPEHERAPRATLQEYQPSGQTRVKLVEPPSQLTAPDTSPETPLCVPPPLKYRQTNV
ncbi:hemicentin-2-like [Ornithodoros turicata]|uniref:hemicentin-2-like n=1 Tax=Ornithodoros turicata TaxID=34597 RepID=UPI003138A6E4